MPRDHPKEISKYLEMHKAMYEYTSAFTAVKLVSNLELAQCLSVGIQLKYSVVCGVSISVAVTTGAGTAGAWHCSW